MYFGLYVFGVRGDQRSLGGPPTGVVRWRYFLGIFIVWAADWCRLGRKKGTWVDGCAADGLGCCRFKEGWGASMAHHACTQTSKMISALLLVLMESRDARVSLASAQKTIAPTHYPIPPSHLKTLTPPQKPQNMPPNPFPPSHFSLHSSSKTSTSARASSTIPSILISFRSYPNGSSSCTPIPSIP